MSERLDIWLVHHQWSTTRTKAVRLIKNGAITVNGQLIQRPSYSVKETDQVTLQSEPDDYHYVSRGALKLVGALSAFIPQGLQSPADHVCLDIGASTGGFTQVLLENGAHTVLALDVGHNQLAESLRTDPRVIDLSGCNIRDTHLTTLPAVPTYFVSDVSFISLTYVIPVIAQLLREEAEHHHIDLIPEIILLIKPQFEVGKGHLGKNGIVVDDTLRQEAIDKVTTCAQHNGFQVYGCQPSSVTGTHGNHEYLLWLRPSATLKDQCAQ